MIGSHTDGHKILYGNDSIARGNGRKDRFHRSFVFVVFVGRSALGQRHPSAVQLQFLGLRQRARLWEP